VDVWLFQIEKAAKIDTLRGLKVLTIYDLLFTTLQAADGALSRAWLLI
jgi:hypothetical protein